MRAKDFIFEKWSAKYKRSINCSNPKGFSQRAHCQGRKKTKEDVAENQLDELKCWTGYTRVKGVPAGAPGSCKKKTNETDDRTQEIEEDLRKWFKEKWVRFNPQGKIMGPCARGSSKEGKPKCLPQSKAHSLGKKGRASAAARKRRQDPNPERKGSAKNVKTKK